MIEHLTAGLDLERVMEVLSTVEDNRRAAKVLGLDTVAVIYLKTNLDLVYRKLILWEKRPALRLVYQKERAA